MKKINEKKITEEVAKLCQEANFYLNENILQSFKKNKDEETSEVAKNILDQLIENAEIAAEEKLPLCQDTGFTVVFIEKGNKVIIEGDLEKAVNQGVKKGYKEGYLRKSIVENPFSRKNTGDNTPAVIHTQIVTGDKLKIIVAPKGGGSENMSKIKMLSPADGKEGVKEFVLNTIEEAGPNPCPPVIVGVGIGGTMEKAALIAKKVLLRDINKPSKNKEIAQLENELLHQINELGIGPQGLGGKTTALGINIEVFPCHIASLPVAVNINCHSSRHKEVVL
ncbi:MAG: fumarate hydratase [Bacillota bacterium]